MALTDGLLAQVYPVSGDAGIKDIVSNTLFSGDGAPTLTTDEGVAAWLISTGTLLTKVLTERTISGSVAGDGVTVAARFKLTANGTNSFLSLLGFKAASDTVDQNIRVSRNGSNNYRGRVNSVLSPTLTGLTNGTVITLVFRVTFRDGTTDTGEIWRNLVSRVGTDPDSVSAGANFGSITFDRAFINCQTDAAFTLFDFAVWGRELTNAECAAVADNYRAVMPAPSGGVTPIAFTGTIADQVFTEGDAVSVNLATGNYTGTETPFSYANTGTALTDTGLTISTSGVLSGTATVGSSAAVVMTGTDTADNEANSNAFSVTVNAAPVVPQGTTVIGTIVPDITSAVIPFTYDGGSDADEFDLYIDSVYNSTTTSSPAIAVDLPAGTPLTAVIIPMNAAGAGEPSDPVGFTTNMGYSETLLPAATESYGTVMTFTWGAETGTVISEPLYRNTNVTTGLLASVLLSYVALYDVDTHQLIALFTDVTTDTNGRYTVTSALIVPGTSYRHDWQISDSGASRMPVSVAE